MAKKQKWYQKGKFYRYLTQAFVLLFILQLVVKEIFKPTEDTVTVSAEAYCPLGGLETLFRYFTDGKYLSHLHASNVIILGLVLLITLIFRSGFCGWLCPFGTIQDLVRGFGKWFGKLGWMKSINGKYHTWLKNNKNGLAKIDRYARFIKYGVLLWAVLGAFYYAELVFRDYDPFVALIKVTELESYTGLGILIVVLVLSLFMERPWCKYTCPLGAAIGIIGKISPLRVSRNEQACIGCNLCTKSCPMKIDVANQTHVKSMDCNQCLVCVDSCPVKGALDIKLVLPMKGKSTPQAPSVKS
ncbi:4Fe-4S binding protein [Tepidibacillus marianensis]|uniref:4Fe-4S binding protein n=1 Tax=Tepidibacillus marianensis TaxID=3131995 RepID=UPI0030CF73EF